MSNVLTYELRIFPVDIVFSTVHKSKGLEFDTVKLTDDYLSVEPGQDRYSEYKHSINFLALIFFFTIRTWKRANPKDVENVHYPLFPLQDL